MSTFFAFTLPGSGSVEAQGSVTDALVSAAGVA